ncbi:MAG: hypothetical protein ACK5Q1_01490, partial [Limnobacter sp.]
MAQNGDDQYDDGNSKDLSPTRLKRRAFLSGLAVGAATVGVAATGAHVAIGDSVTQIDVNAALGEAIVPCREVAEQVQHNKVCRHCL